MLGVYFTVAPRAINSTILKNKPTQNNAVIYCNGAPSLKIDNQQNLLSKEHGNRGRSKNEYQMVAKST